MVLAGGPAGHGPGIVDYVIIISLKVRKRNNNGQNEQKTLFSFASVFHAASRPRKEIGIITVFKPHTLFTVFKVLNINSRFELACYNLHRIAL